MKNLNSFIIACSVVLGIASCKQESVEAEKESDKTPIEAGVSTQKYVYKGSTYSLSLRKGIDGYQVINGKDNQKVHSLLGKPGVAQFVDLRDKNTVYIFDSHDESQLFAKSIPSSKSGRKKTSESTSDLITAVAVNLYTETQYGGVSYLHCAPWSVPAFCEEPDYRYYNHVGQTINLNDQVGSMTFYNPYLHSMNISCFEDPNNGGRSITFYSSGIVDDGVYDLGVYRFGGLFGNKYSWNDRISSSRLNVGY